MKQKLLLLGASMVLLGTVAFGGAFSFDSFDSTALTGTTSVFTPNAPDITLSPASSTIAADGAYHQIHTINAEDTDANYDYTLTQVAVTNGVATEGGTCGSYDYGVDNTGANTKATSFAVPAAGVSDTNEDVYLSISPIGTDTDCTLTGAEITATFVVQGDTGVLP
jgi:hypothetical protein